MSVSLFPGSGDQLLDRPFYEDSVRRAAALPLSRLLRPRTWLAALVGLPGGETLTADDYCACVLGRLCAAAADGADESGAGQRGLCILNRADFFSTINPLAFLCIVTGKVLSCSRGSFDCAAFGVSKHASDLGVL
jgi:hypothetical protein